MEVFTQTELELFEKVWVDVHIKHIYTAEAHLNDDRFIDYHIWEDKNYDLMWKKHSPGAAVIRGKNPNLIFHGACLGCKSQRLHGVDRCRKCCNFRGDQRLQDLFIPGENSDNGSGFLLND